MRDGSVRTRRFALQRRAAWRVEADDEIAFAAGRFVRKKGFEYLVDAIGILAARRPRLRLVLAGGGDLESELRAAGARLGIADRVILPGVLTQGGVADALAASDVAVVPSVRDEAGNVDGLPNVVLESLASATPARRDHRGWHRQRGEARRNGLLVAERDPAALAERDRSRALGSRIGGEAWHRRARVGVDARGMGSGGGAL